MRAVSLMVARSRPGGLRRSSLGRPGHHRRGCRPIVVMPRVIVGMHRWRRCICSVVSRRSWLCLSRLIRLFPTAGRSMRRRGIGRRGRRHLPCLKRRLRPRWPGPTVCPGHGLGCVGPGWPSAPQPRVLIQLDLWEDDLLVLVPGTSLRVLRLFIGRLPSVQRRRSCLRKHGSSTEKQDLPTNFLSRHSPSCVVAAVAAGSDRHA
mmetsp:Transcript_36666/g.75183  ORF Transcript_36666/g.75183 Transcript_36666/m.75183 type:complete len:205 (+) Transcript_36666:215-829(+)